MDSLSQAVLGGAIAVVVSGGKSPKRAIIYGVAIATMPDLDVLQSFDNDVEATARHRTWSHSWIVHTIVAPIFALLLVKFDKTWSYQRWWLMVMLLWITHSGLDALTIYGTGLFWPLQSVSIMGGSVFIIDPLYTLSLLVALILIWRQPNSSPALRFATMGLVISSLYLVWGVFAQNYVETKAKLALLERGLNAHSVISTPTPFNSILWRVIAMDKDQYHEGYFHFLESSNTIQLHSYNRNNALARSLASNPAFAELSKFTHDYYALNKKDSQILVSDLRMGAEPFYFFRFVFTDSEAGSNHDLPRLDRSSVDASRLFSWLGKRLLGQQSGTLTKALQGNPGH